MAIDFGKKIVSAWQKSGISSILSPKRASKTNIDCSNLAPLSQDTVTINPKQKFLSLIKELDNQIFANVKKPFHIEELNSFIKKIYPEITDSELGEIGTIIEKMQNNKNLKFIDIYEDVDVHLWNRLSKKINPSQITYTDYKQVISNGKSITKMTDAELNDYYKKLVPYINDEELNYLIEQIHRINKGEARFLETPQEKNILESIYTKQWFGLRLKGIVKSLKVQTSEKFPKADIEFIDKPLSDLQSNQIRGWIWSGASAHRMDGIFDDLAIPLKKDTYLYRGVVTRTELNYNNQIKFLNSIKEGELIDNSNKYISTSKDVEYASDYRSSFLAGTSYLLKIKVPKGTKVLDIRLSDPSMDEIVLRPNKLKITNIDYDTGVVECEYLPLHNI